MFRPLTAIVLFLALLTAGCRTRPPVNALSPEMPVIQRGLAMDAALARDLTVDKIISSRNGDMMVIQTTVSNQTKKQIPFEYRVEWFDGRGILIDTPASRWSIRHIYGGESMPLVATAPAPEAVDWTLKLKRR